MVIGKGGKEKNTGTGTKNIIIIATETTTATGVMTGAATTDGKITNDIAHPKLACLKTSNRTKVRGFLLVHS